MEKAKKFQDNGIMCCDKTIDPVYNLCLEEEINTGEEFLNYNSKNLKGKKNSTIMQAQGIADLYRFTYQSIPSEEILNLLHLYLTIDENSTQNYYLKYHLEKTLRRLGFNSTQIKMIKRFIQNQKGQHKLIDLLSLLEEKIQDKNIVSRSTKVKIVTLKQMALYKKIETPPTNEEKIQTLQNKLGELIDRIYEYSITCEEIQRELIELQKNDNTQIKMR